MTLKIAALTRRTNTPSSRFRIRQHIPHLLAAGVQVRDYPSPASSALIRLPNAAMQLTLQSIMNIPRVAATHAADAVWISRGLAVSLATTERLTRRPRFLDVDDAIWHNRPRIRHVAQLADTVIAGNLFLADWFSQHCRDVEVIHTAIDTDRFKPVQHPPHDSFVIVWTGSTQNIKYLYQIEAALSRFLRDHHSASLRVVADTLPRFSLIRPEQVDFVPWSVEHEVEPLQTSDVGIMPLADGEWERGKCSFKMLQYMAIGLPVVVSPVGLNAEIMAKGNIGFSAAREEDWYDSLETLYRQRELGRQQGIAGRGIAEQHFSIKVISEKLAALFKSRLTKV